MNGDAHQFAAVRGAAAVGSGCRERRFASAGPLSAFMTSSFMTTGSCCPRRLCENSVLADEVQKGGAGRVHNQLEPHGFGPGNI